MNKVLSISVAAYNAAQDLSRCLDSLVNTSVADLLDIIVVNDGSKDGTLALARSYEQRYPDIIRVIDKENGGHGSTINASIPEAVGKYYKIVDSDDWVDREGLEILVHALMETEADLVLNPFHIIDAQTGKQKTTVYPYRDNAELNKVCSSDNVENIVIEMHSTTYRTDIVKKMGPIIDEHCFYVDLEYTLFPLQYIENYICFDYPVYQYLLGTATQSMNRGSLINRRAQHRKVVKRVISYYEKRKDRVSAGIREIILQRVRLAMLNQYKIYLNMDPAESKKENMAFDRWVWNRSREVYEGPDLRLMSIIRFHRKTGYRFYTAVTALMKKLHLEPVL